MPLSRHPVCLPLCMYVYVFALLLPCARRLLELTGAKEPAALEKLVKAVGVKPASVNKDLLMYKGVLSKLSAAKVREGGSEDRGDVAVCVREHSSSGACSGVTVGLPLRSPQHKAVVHTSCVMLTPHTHWWCRDPPAGDDARVFGT